MQELLVDTVPEREEARIEKNLMTGAQPPVK